MRQRNQLTEPVEDNGMSPVNLRIIPEKLKTFAAMHNNATQESPLPLAKHSSSQ